MNKRIIYPRLILLLSSVALLTGCASPGKNMIPPGGEMTMSQIYQEETGGRAQARQPVRRMASAYGNTRPSMRMPTLPVTHYAAYPSTENNTVDALFKPLPNPEIPLYVYPHMVHANGEEYPKPGMSTAFFLFKRNQFAMPNERY